MMNVYQTIANKLSAKLPITQMLSRKQYIEYKLKYAQKNDANKDVNALSGEYDELSKLIDGIFTYSLTHSLTHSLSLTHLLTYLLTYSISLRCCERI